jgi:pSer/pThr/pTyr-binding forkhead associated (FHA) protein
MPTLTITTGPHEGQSIECDQELVVGREDTDLVVDDSEMSRRHATIRPVTGGLEIEDLGSLNGTFVDGKRISGVTMLTGNASLKMGITLFALEIPVSEEPVVDDPQRTVLRKADSEQPPVDPNRTVIRSRPVESVDKTVVRNVVPQTPGAGAGDPGGHPAGGPSGPTPGGPPAGGPPESPAGAPPGPPGGGPPPTIPLPVRLLMKSPLGTRLLPLLIKLPPRARRPVVMLIPLLLIAIVVAIVVVIVQLVS